VESTLHSTGVRLFGPGYPVFLAISGVVAGSSVVAILGIQIVLAAAGAVLIALLTFRITGQSRVALVAGTLHALSLSALGQSAAFMAEALGLVLTLSGFLLYCRASVQGRLLEAALAGVVLGLAILTSSPAMILLLALPVLTLAHPSEPDEPWTATLRRRSPVWAVATAMMLFLPTLWIVHNRATYGVHYVRQIEAVNRIRSAAAFRLYQDGTPFETSMAEAGDSIRVQAERLGNEHQAFEAVSVRVFEDALLRNPWMCLAVYLGTIDDNVNTDDGVWLTQFPHWQTALRHWKTVSETYLLRYRMLVLCLIGVWVLIRQKEKRLAWVLAGLFVIFALGAGVSPWQGNRLFYAGQIASSPLMAVAILAACDRVRSRLSHGRDTSPATQAAG